MRALFLIFCFVFLLHGPFVLAQQASGKFAVNGYFTNMQSVTLTNIDGEWMSDNLFHNRVNVFWYPNQHITASLQFRNRLMYGQSIIINPDYARSVDRDNGFLDLSLNILNKKSFFLNSTIDRAYIQYSGGKFVGTLGRQRINWGQCFVWNPNDLFNVQNFFDFDYAEKQGSDAIRLQYYTGYASSLEFAAKMDNLDRLTWAGYYRFNKWSYDFQLLAGIFEESDYVAGLGWAGDIKGAGFRGEMSYFQPKENFSDTSGLMLFSVSADYTLPSSLYLQVEGLYNSRADDISQSGFMDYFQGSLNVKKMSFSKWSLFGQASWPATPLLNCSLSFIYFPDMKGYYTGPSVDYSLKENMMLSVVFQLFSGELPDPHTGQDVRTNFGMGFLRYKWNF